MTTRRFDAAGMRRNVRTSGDASAAAPAGPTLAELLTRHSWLFFWDPSLDFDAGADTWADQVGAMTMTSSGSTVTSSTLGGQPAVRIQSSSGQYFGAGPESGLAFQPMRIFAAVSVAAYNSLFGTVLPVLAEANATGGFLRVDAATNAESNSVAEAWVFGGTLGAASSRAGLRIDDGAAKVLRIEFDQTHAQTIFRVNGSAYSADGQFTSDPLAYADASGWMTVGYATVVGGDTKIAALFGCAYSAINDTQAAQVEADLRTIMGV